MNLAQAVEDTWEMLRNIMGTLPPYADAAEEQKRLASAFYAAGFYASGGRAQLEITANNA